MSNVLLCDEDCNHCPIILHKNSRMITKILNELLNKFGDGVYAIVQKNCPNLTCCRDCHIDDFCHIEGCKLKGETDKNTSKMLNTWKEFRKTIIENEFPMPEREQL